MPKLPDILAELIGRRHERPPETLYHYATPEALLGIVSSKTMWASGIHYLNDASEFTHALDIAETLLRKTRRRKKRPETIEMLERVELRLSEARGVNVFVGSLSEAKDLLSQWRAYGGPRGGYSIGFVSQELRKHAGRQGFILAPCLYSGAEQKQLVQLVIDKLVSEFQGELHGGQSHMRGLMQHTSWLFLERVVRIAPLLKHPSFAEEREWRLISEPMEASETFGFRATDSMIVPYYSFLLAPEPQAIPLSELVVGPTPHPGHARDSALQLLRVNGIQCPVDISTIPYRSW